MTTPINSGIAAHTDDNGKYLTSAGTPSHFNKSEMSCRCGCGESRMSQAIIDADEKLRVLVGVPIKIDRGVSCAAHNAAVGGAADSEHLPVAYASDKTSSLTEEDFFIKATITHNRVGLYLGQPGLIHADYKVDNNSNPLHLYWFRENGVYNYFENSTDCLAAYKARKAALTPQT